VKQYGRKEFKRLRDIENYIGGSLHLGATKINTRLSNGSRAVITCMSVSATPLEWLMVMEALIEQHIIHAFPVDQVIRSVNAGEQNAKRIPAGAVALFLRTAPNGSTADVSWNRPHDFVVPKTYKGEPLRSVTKLLSAIDDYEAFIERCVELQLRG